MNQPKPLADNDTFTPELHPTEGETYAQWLTRVERDQTHPNIRPRDAATIILVDRTTDPARVLLGRRHRNHKFMPGKFVFPGGRLDPTDRTLPVAAPLHPEVTRQLMRRTPRANEARARAFGVAVIRELFEETGLMVGTTGGPSLPHSEPWDAFARLGFGIDLSGLHLVVRAITPPRRPRRFDTRFFALDASAVVHRVEGVVGPDTELTELVWLPIAEARTLEMPTITKVALHELEDRVASGFALAAPVPFYRVVSGKYVRELLLDASPAA